MLHPYETVRELKSSVSMKDEDSQILRGGHNGELDSSLVSKRLVAPLPHRSNLLDSSDTVVGDEDLKMSESKSQTGRARIN